MAVSCPLLFLAKTPTSNWDENIFDSGNGWCRDEGIKTPRTIF